MNQLAAVVFLLDVDNTLIDNDRITSDLRRHLTQAFGAERRERYWAIFEELRTQLGYADYLGALQRYRAENPRDPNFLQVSFFLTDYHFADRLFRGSLDLIDHLTTCGPTVILSDGDVVFQPRKVERSGLLEAVAGRVLIYIHKEQESADVEIRYPARRYVLVDDKLRILTAVKKVWGSRLTTVFPRQRHYALDPKVTAAYPPCGHYGRVHCRLAAIRFAGSIERGQGRHWRNRGRKEVRWAGRLINSSVRSENFRSKLQEKSSWKPRRKLNPDLLRRIRSPLSFRACNLRNHSPW